MSVHHFANSIFSCFAKTVNKIVRILNPKVAGCAIYWFRENSMIAKPDKFQAILLDKRNSDFYLNKNIRIDKENIKIVPNVKMLSRCSY